MKKGSRVLSEVVRVLKYARYLPEYKRRETWDEIVERNIKMHTNKFPFLEDEIKEIYKGVLSYKFLPSMRSLQFGLTAIEKNNSRIYNCAYVPLWDHEVFGEIMFLLLSGCGVGFSVQTHHISKLPELDSPSLEVIYEIEDTIEGWADAVKALVSAFIGKGSFPIFDYSKIRPEGAELKTSGGKAPGPEPLKRSLDSITEILRKVCEKSPRRLRSIDCHDIICWISKCVYAGGIRRSALLSLFSYDDEDMISCKSGEWWIHSSQRSLSNNSVALPRNKITKEQFFKIWSQVEASGSGEPGIYFTASVDGGVNPCNEAFLRPYEFCNLTEVNVSDVETQEELEYRVKGAAFIGTLQASYTNFHYLRPIWKETTEADALLGVGMTGIASGKVLSLDLRKAAKVVVEENERVAKLIGINIAARSTLLKPSGTASLLLGCSSGIHAWHSSHYIRRIRLGKNEPIYEYFLHKIPELVEEDLFNPQGAILSLPVSAPKGSIFRDEPTIQLLRRIKKFNEEWILQGHRYGENSHNVSATVSVKPGEWAQVGEWMWHNKDYYNGLSVLPEDGGTYKQAPFEATSEEKIKEMEELLKDLDIGELIEHEDLVNFELEPACVGGLCEL
jgi:ribonucleoside-diphosphate reductase alpha chain